MVRARKPTNITELKQLCKEKFRETKFEALYQISDQIYAEINAQNQKGFAIFLVALYLYTLSNDQSLY